MPVQYHFCRVCRHNQVQGKAHRFSAKHKQRLDALLKKIHKNVQEVRFFLKNAMRLKANLGSRSRFWCHICEQEISEEKSLLACAETIRHLASKQHLEAVKSFWFENGGDVSKRQAFIVSDADFRKWEEACKALPTQGPDFKVNETNNIHSERCLADATSAENANQCSVFCGSSLAVKPLSVLTDQRFLHFGHANGKVEIAASTSSQPSAVDQSRKPQCENEAHADGKGLMQDTRAYTYQGHWHHQVATPAESRLLSSAQDSVSNLPKTQSGKQTLSGSLGTRQSTGGVPVSVRQTESALGQNLTAIRPPSLNPGEGNVHSGAPPPWLKPNSGEGSGLQASPLLPLSRTQQRKLAKLRNPNRVGAAWAEQRLSEMERERRGEVVEKSVPDSSAWLPSFGRVWQSGSRRETRKEFEAEKRSERRKRSDLTFTDTSKIHPYVSKRQRTTEGPDGVKQDYEGTT